jgi:hypothetical protein
MTLKADARESDERTSTTEREEKSESFISDALKRKMRVNLFPKEIQEENVT